MATVCLDLLIHEKSKLVFTRRELKKKAKILNLESQMEKVKREQDGKRVRLECHLYQQEALGAGLRWQGHDTLCCYPSGLLNLPGAQGRASVPALQAHFPCPLNFSVSGGGSGLCKISKQGLEMAAAVHLPGHCQFLEITLALCLNGFSTEKRGWERRCGQIALEFLCFYPVIHIFPGC